MTEAPDSADDLLLEIADHILQLPPVKELRSHDDFMRASVDAANDLFRLAMIAVSIARPGGKGYPRRQAPIVGLTVRLTKLYGAIIGELAASRAEVAHVLFRPFLESLAKCRYIMKHGPRTSRSFIETSFRPEKEMLTHLNKVLARRGLTTIERRMRRRISRELKEAGISQASLTKRTSWELQGRSIEQIFAELGGNVDYAFRFASSSHYIHGSWHEILAAHLRREGRQYFPDLRSMKPDPREIWPLSVRLGQHIQDYVFFFRLDPGSIVRDLADDLVKFYEAVGDAWELEIQSTHGCADAPARTGPDQ